VSAASSSAASRIASVAALFRRDLRIQMTYHFQLALRLVEVAFFLGVAYYVSELVVDSPELESYGGNYFDFLVVGLAITTFATLGLSVFTTAIGDEQRTGTLELLLASPTSVSVLLAGGFAVPLILSVVEAALYFGIGAGFLGAGFGLGAALLAVPLVLATLASFCAFGILSASFIVLTKRGDPFTLPATYATSLLSGALFPVTLLPAPLQWLAHAFPAYYGINGIRKLLLAGAGFSDVAGDLLVLIGFGLVLIPLSLAVMRRALRIARVTGTLGTY